MSEMIEKVAKAMYEAGEKELHSIFPGRFPKISWDQIKADASKDPRHGDIYLKARVAIEAMREPTNEMCEAAYDMKSVYDALGEDLKEVWAAMINTALKE